MSEVKMRRATNPLAFVTGAGSGIGRAIALNQAAQGYSVAVVDINQEFADRVASEALMLGAAKSISVHCDIRIQHQVEAAFALCVDELGIPDRVVANAGIEISSLAHETTLEEWNRVIDTNLSGTFLTCQAALRLFLANDVKGTIVCVSSPSASVGFAGGRNSAYGSSKGGISALVRALAIDYAACGIRVNAVVPGATATPILEVTTSDSGRNPVTLAAEQIPLGRLARPEEIADAVNWLLSDKATYVTGSHVFVDGGLTARGSNDF